MDAQADPENQHGSDVVEVTRSGIWERMARSPESPGSGDRVRRDLNTVLLKLHHA
jgi:hypothetical protein